MAFQIATIDGKKTLQKYIPEPNETEIIVPDGVEVIGRGFFYQREKYCFRGTSCKCQNH